MSKIGGCGGVWWVGVRLINVGIHVHCYLTLLDATLLEIHLHLHSCSMLYYLEFSCTWELISCKATWSLLAQLLDAALLEAHLHLHSYFKLLDVHLRFDSCLMLQWNLQGLGPEKEKRLQGNVVKSVAHVKTNWRREPHARGRSIRLTKFSMRKIQFLWLAVCAQHGNFYSFCQEAVVKCVKYHAFWLLGFCSDCLREHRNIESIDACNCNGFAQSDCNTEILRKKEMFCI